MNRASGLSTVNTTTRYVSLSEEKRKQEIFFVLHSWKNLAIDRMVKGTITFQEFIEDITQHLTLKQYQGKTLQELFLLLDINLQNLFPSSETIAPKKHIQNEKDSTYLKKKYSLGDLEKLQKITENQFHRHINNGDLAEASDSMEFMSVVNKALGTIGA